MDKIQNRRVTEKIDSAIREKLVDHDLSPPFFSYFQSIPQLFFKESLKSTFSNGLLSKFFGFLTLQGLLSEHYDKHPVFILKDVKFKELKAMMDYMYRGEVNISQDQLAALLKAAESLQIKGLSESKTGGNNGSKTDSSRQQQKVVTQPTAPSLDIPHASSGLTIEKNNKVPRQSLAQSSVGDLPEDSASPQLPKGLSSR